jgi:hypothetical protein
MRQQVWYHGTYRRNVASILATGVTSIYYGTRYKGFGSPYHTLGRQRIQAALGDRDTLITLHIPNDEAAQYLTCLDSTATCCHGWESGLLQPIPPWMVVAAEPVHA